MLNRYSLKGCLKYIKHPRKKESEPFILELELQCHIYFLLALVRNIVCFAICFLATE